MRPQLRQKKHLKVKVKVKTKVRGFSFVQQLVVGIAHKTKRRVEFLPSVF